MSKKHELIHAFQELLVNVQSYHWLTSSYARHVASDKLYKELGELVDRFVETYIGRYGRPNTLEGTLVIKKLSDKELVAYLKSSIEWLQGRIVGPNDVDLLNLRDEIVGRINQAIYLCGLS